MTCADRGFAQENGTLECKKTCEKCTSSPDCSERRLGDYCNFDYEDYGLCESCSDIGDARCEGRGFVHPQGKDECKLQCGDGTMMIQKLSLQYFLSVYIELLINIILIFVQSVGCYNGTQGSEQLIECPMGLDRCVYAYPIPDTGFAGLLCALSTNMTEVGFTDNACSTVSLNDSAITACICDTAGCNKELSETNSK